MVTKYRKKPVVVEVLQWTGANMRNIEIFIGRDFYFKGNDLIIKTLEGDHTANVGDFIIKGIANEFYPCKPDIFEETYEKVE